MIKRIVLLGVSVAASFSAVAITLLFLSVARAYATPIYVAANHSVNYPRVLAGNALNGKVYIGRIAAALAGDVVVADDVTGNVITTVTLPHPPQEIAINRATQQAYVVTWAPHDRLYMLDGTTNVMTEVVASSTSFYRLHVAVNANNNKVYLSGYQDTGGGLYDMYLSMFDGNTLTYSPTLHLGQTGFMEPQVLVVTNTNKAYVRTPAGVMVIDSATNQVNTTVPLGSIYGAMAANPLNGDLYVADVLSGIVAVVDGLSDSIVATVTVGITPTYIAVNPLTNLAYVANYGDGTVSVIDGASRSLAATVTVGGIPRKVEIDTALNRVYVATTTRLKAIDGVSHNVYEPDLIYRAGGDFSNFQDLLVMPSHKVYLADRNNTAADGHWYVLADIDLAASTIQASPNQLPVDGISSSTITTTLLDSLGAPVPGVNITLTASGSQPSLTGAHGVTGANGQASACLWSALTETKTVTATLPEGKVLSAAAVVTFTATPPTATVVGPGQPGTIVYTDATGLLTQVAVPAGAVTTTTVLRYTPMPPPSSQPAGLQFAGLAFQLDAFRGCGAVSSLNFLAPITVTLQYPDPEALDLHEASLALWRWTGQAWSSAAIVVLQRNEAVNQLIATLTNASQFALFGASQQAPWPPYSLHLPFVAR